ncbi:MAG TPA: hypothetical protein VHL08_09185 [Dongiaceae bacterium]|jgi:hypothetical protein|nr:hypothetical protein [Dongiaceae bacterium]
MGRALALLLGCLLSMPAQAQLAGARARDVPEGLAVYMGHWTVAAILPDKPDKDYSLRVGAALWLLEKAASDLEGRSCAEPDYAVQEERFSRFLGAHAFAGDRERPIKALVVACGSDPFGTYVLLANGFLLLVREEALYLLERDGSGDFSALSPGRDQLFQG